MTPQEQYWKNRCEAAEKLIENVAIHLTDENIKYYAKWHKIFRTEPPAPAQGVEEAQLRQLFKNNSNCYADTWSQDGLGAPMVEGDVIQAMTEERFIEVVAPIAGSRWQQGQQPAPTIGARWVRGEIEKRISYLKKADAEVCKERWDMTQPELKRSVARDTSNFLTERRHELEDLLKTIPADESPATFPTREQAEQWAKETYAEPNVQTFASLAMYDWIVQQIKCK